MIMIEFPIQSLTIHTKEFVASFPWDMTLPINHKQVIKDIMLFWGCVYCDTCFDVPKVNQENMSLIIYSCSQWYMCCARAQSLQHGRALEKRFRGIMEPIYFVKNLAGSAKKWLGNLIFKTFHPSAVEVFAWHFPQLKDGQYKHRKNSRFEMTYIYCETKIWVQYFVINFFSPLKNDVF